MTTLSRARAEPLSLAATGPAWTRGLGYAGGAFLGVVLLVAAWAKALDPLAFAQQIHSEKLDFLLSAHALAATRSTSPRKAPPRYPSPRAQGGPAAGSDSGAEREIVTHPS